MRLNCSCIFDILKYFSNFLIYFLIYIYIFIFIYIYFYLLKHLTHASDEVELFLSETLIDDLIDQFHEDLIVHVLQVATDGQLTVSELYQVRDLISNI